MQHLDTDDFYWKKTDPRFVDKEKPEDRVQRIQSIVSDLDGWVLSGSMCSWGDALQGHFKYAIFLLLEPKIRLQRIMHREVMRYGNRIEPNGDMHHQHLEFIDWARSYDTAQPPTRSLALHRQWMKSLPCPVLELDSSIPIDELVDRAIRFGA